MQKLILMKSSLSFFFLVSCTFNAVSNKLPDPRLWRLTPKFSYNSFYSYILVKNPLWIHFGRGPMSFFCMWIHSCPRTLSYKDCSFPLLNYLSTHNKNQLTIHIRFLSGLSILFYCSMSILKPVPHYCSFVVNFEIGKYENSNFVLLMIVWLFWVIWISLLILESACQFLQRSQFLQRDCVEFVDQYGGILSS